jgi:universal stress protein A
MTIQPRRILWPTDLSDLSLKGGQYARGFCDTFRAELHVLHVAPVIVFDSTTVMMTAGDAPVGVIDSVTPARNSLKSFLLEHFGRSAKSIRSEVISGNAWYEICRYAQLNRIDLIVLATHGVTGFKHLLMGSTAERVVQHANCPVLTVKSFQREMIAANGAAKTPDKKNRRHRRRPATAMT